MLPALGAKYVQHTDVTQATFWERFTADAFMKPVVVLVDTKEGQATVAAPQYDVVSDEGEGGFGNLYKPATRIIVSWYQQSGRPRHTVDGGIVRLNTMHGADCVRQSTNVRSLECGMPVRRCTT